MSTNDISIVSEILRPSLAGVKRSIVEAKLRAKGINLEPTTRFEKIVLEYQLDKEGGKYKREPDVNGNWPCATCYEFKPLNEFSRNQSRGNGHNNSCKPCELEFARRYRKRKLTKTSQQKPPTPKLKDHHKICFECKEEKHFDNFGQSSAKKFGKASICKQCMSLRFKSKQVGRKENNLNDCLRQLYASAMNHSRILGREITITKDYIFEIYQRQQGYCYISNVFMTLKTHSKFKMSLERINNQVGYIPGNVCLIAKQFQTCDYTKYSDPEVVTGSGQWSRSKFVLAHHLYCHDFDQARQQSILDNLKEPIVRQYNYKHEEVSKDIWRCQACGNPKPVIQFARHLGTRFGHLANCKTCEWHYHNDNIHFFLYRKLQNMKNNSKRKNLPCTLTLDDLKQLLIKQNGLCAISKIPMSLRSLSDWQCSPERLDNSKGYEDGNVVLICLEFNSSDQSKGPGVKPADVEYIAQWTPELYKKVFWPNGITQNPQEWIPPHDYEF